MRDLKRVKEYIELGFDKEDAIKMVDEEGATVQEVIVEPQDDKKKKEKTEPTLTPDEVKKIIAEEKQKENLTTTSAEPNKTRDIESAFKNILG